MVRGLPANAEANLTLRTLGGQAPLRSEVKAACNVS